MLHADTHCFLFSWQQGSIQTLWMRLAAYQEPEGAGSSSRNRGNQAAGLFWCSAHAPCVWSGQLGSVRSFLSSVAYSHRRVTGPLKAHFSQTLLHRPTRQANKELLDHAFSQKPFSACKVRPHKLTQPIIWKRPSRQCFHGWVTNVVSFLTPERGTGCWRNANDLLKWNNLIWFFTNKFSPLKETRLIVE